MSYCRQTIPPALRAMQPCVTVATTHHRDYSVTTTALHRDSTEPPPPPLASITPGVAVAAAAAALLLWLGNFFQLHDTSKVESQGWYLYLKNASDDKRPGESECVNRARPVEKGGRVQRGCERPVVEVGCEVQFL